MSKAPVEDVTVPSAPPCYEECMSGHSGIYPSFGQFQTAPTNPYLYPPQGYYPGPQPAGAVAQQTQPVIQVRAALPVGPKPLKCTCHSCNKEITTRVNYKNRYAPHICCFILLATVICSCFSCLPYCLWPSEKVEHFCPNCNAFLGVYSRK